MRKILIYIGGIILCLIVADITIGICSKYYISNYQLKGRYQPLDKLIKEIDTDIILIGNSTIYNSVDPQVLEDSLSMTCYNGGITGQGVYFFETIIDCILQRHTPKMILIGLRPEEIGTNVGDGIYDVLKPYYGLGHESIDNHFNSIGGFDRLLLYSNMIRYNTIWIRVLLYMLYDNTKYTKNGFLANEVPAEFPQIKIIKDSEPINKDRLKCIERIIHKCAEKKIKLSICFPPTLLSFEQKNIPCVTAIKALCSRYNIPCIIDFNNSYFLNHPELFHDNVHVNKIGAKKYSEIIAHILHKQIDHQ